MRSTRPRRAGSVRTSRGSNERGFDVTVYRTVVRGREADRQRRVPSHYIAVGPTPRSTARPLDPGPVLRHPDAVAAYCASAFAAPAPASRHARSVVVAAAPRSDRLGAGRPSRAAARGRRARSSRRASSSSRDPVEQLAPVVRPTRTTGKCEHLAGLDQRQRLEQLVERAEAAGEDDEALGRLHEARLARVEVLEGSPMSRYGFGSCSCGSSMLKPTESPPRLLRAAVRGLHHARAAAGDDGPAAPRRRAAPAARARLVRRGCPRAMRAEPKIGRPPAGRCVATASKPATELARRSRPRRSGSGSVRSRMRRSSIAALRGDSAARASAHRRARARTASPR